MAMTWSCGRENGMLRPLPFPINGDPFRTRPPVLFPFVASVQVSENYEMYASQGKGVPVVG